ncbi:MAG: hypothetical protein JWQ30_549 [Sediminibacterium sp.]|nr:hypothetical protein [Sediminibacterium sp.]
MSNITYLLGAGASSNCLPIYANFKERFSEFAELFGKNRHLYHELDEDYKRRADQLLEIIEKIKAEFKFHSTPDTIAKKYFHRYGKNSSELIGIKEVIILFFMHQQTVDNTELVFRKVNGEKKDIVDQRYDAFIASLLKPISGSVEILEKFKILTWNYDLQFEKAFLNYKMQDLSVIQENIQSYPNVNGNSDNTFDSGKFSIIHLNGLAYARPLRHISYDCINSFHAEDSLALRNLLDIYKSLHYHQNGPAQFVGGSSLLSFAWENQNPDFTLNNNLLLTHAKEIARHTEILVIIGYSFPVFNNHVDMDLLNEMLELKKVYIQSPQASEIINILKGKWFKNSGHLREENIVDLGFWNQFYIPND